MTDLRKNRTMSKHNIWKITGLLVAIAFVFVGAAAAVSNAPYATGPASMDFLIGVAIGIVSVALLSLICYWLYQKFMVQGRTPDDMPLSTKEKLNRNILVACGVIGGIIALALSLETRNDPAAIFGNTPLRAGFAITLAIVWGICIPVLSLYWHRNAIDEQEADAYKTGALFGFYLYTFGAPVWWILWRGGLLPPPDGPLIYYAVLMTAGAIWLKKKYF